MYNTRWIEPPVDSQREPSPEETALRETYLAAQKIAFQLVCASNQLTRVESPDVTACAAILREALRKPEKEKASAVKAAGLTVLHRQVDYVSTHSYYLQYAEAWLSIRPTLVAQLEAVAVRKEEPNQRPWTTPQPVSVDLCLNCQAVGSLIDECDMMMAEATKRQFSRPTQKHAEAGFQKTFDALVAEVTGANWVFDAKLACRANHSADILRDVPVEKVSSTHLPAEYVKCGALDAAREAFERAFCYDTTTTCRDFQQTTRGTLNEPQMAESLLAAMPDLSAMTRIEEQRDAKLLAFGRSWRGVRHLVDNCQSLFITVAELLPEAVAEAAAIDDEKVRRQAQNLCLFAARRLKENLKFIRECDRQVGDRDQNYADISVAANRVLDALVQRIKSKEIYRPSTRCREEPYLG
jgi:hypothetical protein